MTERDDFGPGLRRQRERSGMTLEAIASRTKVSASLYAALERNDFSKWPAGIFRRSFIRGYAEAIGLEPGEIVAEFLRLFPEEPEGARPEGKAGKEGKDWKERKDKTPPFRFNAADPEADADLRLTLADERPLLSQWGMLGLLERRPRRARAAVIDLSLVGALSAAATAMAGWGAFWICLGIAALAYQLVTTVFFHSSLGVWLSEGGERSAGLAAPLASITGAASPPRGREASNVVSHPSSRKLARRRMRLGA